MAGCGSSHQAGTDAGMMDAALVDARAADAPLSDARSVDAPTVDAVTLDAYEEEDAGSDGGVDAAEDPDAATNDAGPPDAGECVPGSARCVGASVQFCSALAEWLDAGVCPEEHCNGAGICGACEAGEVGCVGDAPQHCDELGRWVVAPPCDPATSRCVAGACSSCLLTMCDAECVDTQRDPSHCGACGNACSSDSVETFACDDARCAPTCAPNRLDCNSYLAARPNDGCECVGTDCCAVYECQAVHTTLGTPFYDCTPGLNSISAWDACRATLPRTTCSSCFDLRSLCSRDYCWIYAGPDAGTVRAAGAGCASPGPPVGSWT